MLKWGLIPSWAKDPKIGYSLINARADTVATKPSFRSAFKRRRCLVVAEDSEYVGRWIRRRGRCQNVIVAAGAIAIAVEAAVAV